MRIKKELSIILKELKRYPFEPAYNIPHVHTFYGRKQNKKKPLIPTKKEFLKVRDGSKILIDYHWQKNHLHNPTIVTVHGLEGSSDATYIRGLTRKALTKGFNVVNLNLRNCGQTEKYCKNLYHAGQSEDVREVITHLIKKEKLKEIYLIGISLGGNISLKLTGEYGKNPPKELRGVIGYSPLLDLRASGKHVERLQALLYRKRFLRRLREKIQTKAKYYPEYATHNLKKIKSFKEFDETFCKYYGDGFVSPEEYYTTASAFPYLKNIRVPTLIIQAEDDPLIPLEPLRKALAQKNPYIIALITKKGGHVGFVSKNAEGADDHFWGENRILQYFSLLHFQEYISKTK